MSNEENNMQQQAGQQQAAAPAGEKAGKKKHTVLIVVIVVLVVLVLGGLASCYACSAIVGEAVDETLEGETADSVSSSGSSESEDGEEDDGDGEEAAEAVVLYDAKDITISVTERGEDWLGAYYTVEIVNDSDSSVLVSIDDVSVDGVMADTLIAETVSAGKSATEELDFTDIDDMDDLVNVEGTITLSDGDTLMSIDETTFTIE